MWGTKMLQWGSKLERHAQPCSGCGDDDKWESCDLTECHIRAQTGHTGKEVGFYYETMVTEHVANWLKYQSIYNHGLVQDYHYHFLFVLFFRTSICPCSLLDHVVHNMVVHHMKFSHQGCLQNVTLVSHLLVFSQFWYTQTVMTLWNSKLWSWI